MLNRIVPPESGRNMYRDRRVSGLYLQVTSKGTMTWYVSGRIDGKQVKRSLGKYSKYKNTGLGLTEARQLAEKYKASLKCGIDPEEAKRAAKLRSKQTFDAVFQVFMEKHVKRNLKISTAQAYQNIFAREFFDTWREKPVNSITRHDVLMLLSEIADRGTLTLANRVLAYTRKFFNWCAEMDYIKHDEAIPTDRVKPPLKKENKRQRFLSLEETACVYKAASELGYPFGHYFLLLILTGQRSGEVANLRWADMKFEECSWHQGDNKAGRLHMVPLNDLAMGVINQIPKMHLHSELVFTTNGATPISGFSKAKQRLDARALEIATHNELSHCFVEPWRTHDLRRTVTTHLRRGGVSREVCGRILNHKENGVTAMHYDIYDMHDEKVLALDNWNQVLIGYLSQLD